MVKTLQVVCDHYNFPKDGKVMNDQGDTPWHLAMNAKRKHGLPICEVLCKYPINPKLTNRCGRRADDRVPDSDKRLEYYKEAEQSFRQPQIEEPIKPKRKRQRVKEKKSKGTEGEHSPASKRPQLSTEIEIHNKISKAQNTLETMPPIESVATVIPDSTVETWTAVTSHLLRIMSEGERYFTNPSVSSAEPNNSSQDVDQDETGVHDESGSSPPHSEDGPEPAASHPDQERGNHSMQDTNRQVPKGGSAAEPTASHPDQDTRTFLQPDFGKGRALD